MPSVVSSSLVFVVVYDVMGSLVLFSRATHFIVEQFNPHSSMDHHQLAIISQFKQRVLLDPQSSLDAIGSLNRGHKLAAAEGPVAEVIEATTTLHPQAVEYDGRNYLVWLLEAVDRANRVRKRKWHQTYDPPAQIPDSDSDDNDDDIDDHPYKQVAIGELLAPINHPLEIVLHPAASRTYKLPIFNQMAMELIELIEVEQTNLNWLNKLLQVLNGEDWYYLLDDHLGLPKYNHGLTDDKAPPPDEDGPDPFFALPEALTRYDAHQRALEADDNVLKEELINYLQVLIQRQHEYIKNLTTIRNGLVRSDRLKRDIYKWSKEMHDKKST